MNRTILLILSVVCGGLTIAVAQTDRSQTIKELLALPAPPPRSATLPVLPEEPGGTLPNDFYFKENPPRDDAPIEHLIQYWEFWATQYAHQPSDKVGQRLLESCVENPKTLFKLLPIIPQTEAGMAKVKELYDKAADDPDLDDEWRSGVRTWLVYNSNYFLDELSGIASQAKDEANGLITGHGALVALARVSWERAEPLLRRIASSDQQRAAALALSLFYRHAIQEKDATAEERYRNLLRLIASDRTQPGTARGTAIEFLSETAWTNRDEWYLSLFEDESLIQLNETQRTFSPLTELFFSDRDKWIPVMARLLESKNPTIRNSAATCLMYFKNEKPRRDAVLPLLPWLTDPSWIEERSGERLRFIESLYDLDIPESVPGLISVVDNETTGLRSAAAFALTKYKDPRATPSLKRALLKEPLEDHRYRIIHALVYSHGFTDEEQLEALEAYALKVITPEGRTEVERDRAPEEEPLALQISIGKFLSDASDLPESLVHAVLFRAESLKSSNPLLAKKMVAIVHSWDGRQINLDMINRIANGTADTDTIQGALDRREKLRKTAGAELHALMALGGTAQGIGAVLLEDSSSSQGILAGRDQLAQTALLACARYTQMALPVELVGPRLYSKNELLASAAEAYLLAEDSTEARELLWRRHPNEGFITGWLEPFEAHEHKVAIFIKFEKKLRAELFEENGPTEIYALLGNNNASFLDNARILRVYPDKAVYTHHDDVARYRERTITKEELAVFKQELTTSGLTDQGPTIAPCHYDCESSDFLSLNKEKGRRVFGIEDVQVAFDSFADHFNRLGTGAKLVYNLEKQIKGLEILYTDKYWQVKDVWQEGSDIRIFIERELTEEEEAERYAGNASVGAEDDSEEAVRKRMAVNKARSSWRTLVNGKTGSVAAQPDGYSTVDGTRFSVDETEVSGDTGRKAVLVNPDLIVVARHEDGLWKQAANTKAVRLGSEEAVYLDPVVAPGGKWVVVSKAGTDSADPSHIVRVNLRTGREYRVNVEPADAFEPVVFLPFQNMVLLYRSKDSEYGPGKVGPERPEYYLLNADTGDVRLVTGEFRPLREWGKRFLQPTETPGEYWAAMGDEEKNQTQVGRYSLKDFSFTPVLTVPHLFFSTMTMWVDAKNGKLYVVYKDQLLRLPFQPAPK